MSIKHGSSVGLLTLALAFGACSSGSNTTGTGGTNGGGGTTGGGGTGGGSTLPVITACKAFCVAEKDCKADTTVEDCYDYRCNNPAGLMPFASQSAGCQSAFKAYYDCLATQSMICDNGQANIPGACMSQLTAVQGANCSPD